MLGIGGLCDGVACWGLVGSVTGVGDDYRATVLDRGALSRLSSRSMLTSQPPRRGLEQSVGSPTLRRVGDDGRTPEVGLAWLVEPSCANEWLNQAF